VAADLWVWQNTSQYRQPEDWVFASPHTHGLRPFWPDITLAKVIRPAAVKAGIRKRIGWHTFRHSFSTLLGGNGENVKVVQGADAARECPVHAGDLFTGSGDGEAESP
jgi:site-specific recombinase XerD